MRYIIPFAYLFESRLRSLNEKVSWILINPVPIFLLVFGLSDLYLVECVVLFALALVVWQMVYEVGYLENDVFTTKKEEHPTFRIAKIQASLIEARFKTIVVVRLLVAALLLSGIVAYEVHSERELGVVWFVSVVAVGRIAFYVHNRVRSRFNIATFGVLSVTKYAAIPLLLVPSDDRPTALLMSMAIFPLVRTIEHSAKVKYGFLGLRRIVGEFHSFRVMYYVFSLGVACLLFWMSDCDDLRVVVAVLLYFAVYRTIIWVGVRNDVIRT